MNSKFYRHVAHNFSQLYTASFADGDLWSPQGQMQTAPLYSAVSAVMISSSSSCNFTVIVLLAVLARTSLTKWPWNGCDVVLLRVGVHVCQLLHRIY